MRRIQNDTPDEKLNMGAVASMGPSTLLLPFEAADALRISKRTLERWRSQGIGPPPIRIGLRKTAYRAADLLEFSEQSNSLNFKNAYLEKSHD
jgi:predicted DNA-binding transcriptional regulator AlpA